MFIVPFPPPAPRDRDTFSFPDRLPVLPFHSALAFLLPLFVAAPLRAQDFSSTSDPLAELRALHAELTSNRRLAVSRAAGEAALDRFANWNISESTLQSDDQLRFVECSIIAALAVGDVRSAVDYLDDLKRLRPDTLDTLELTYQTACAAGDAKACSAAIKSLQEKGLDKALAHDRAKRLRTVSTLAPDESLKLSDGVQLPLRQRFGTPLILFFWNVRNKPGDQQIAAMCDAYEQFGPENGVTFLTVNADAPNATRDAMDLARTHKMKWKHHYEDKGAGAPITHKLFKAGAEPLQVLIDGDGRFRAGGDPADPGQVYALRALCAEAMGRFKPLEMRSIDGKPPQEPAGDSADQAPKKPKPDAKDSQKDSKPAAQPAKRASDDHDLGGPADPEALLREARTFWRTGHKTKARELFRRIVTEFPDSEQARTAKDYLDIP